MVTIRTHPMAVNQIQEDLGNPQRKKIPKILIPIKVKMKAKISLKIMVVQLLIMQIKTKPTNQDLLERTMLSPKPMSKLNLARMGVEHLCMHVIWSRMNLTPTLCATTTGACSYACITFSVRG